MFSDFRKKIFDLVVLEKPKEYACHIQYVVTIGLRLAEAQGVNLNVIEIACLLHDIGRDKELPNEEHAETGYRLAQPLLEDSPFTESEKKIILNCIRYHNIEDTPQGIEEQIVRSADAGSKVEYHEAFMLMCKKNTYEEKLIWGLKYLEKGYKKISFSEYKKDITPTYERILKIYQKTSEYKKYE